MRPPTSSRGRGSSRGGRGERAAAGRGIGGGRFREPEAPPSTVVELGVFVHPCENEMVYKSINDKIPYFNASAFLENKTKIGKIDEIFGAITDVMFTVKPENGVPATSFQAGDKVYISPDKLLPLNRFTEQGKKKGSTSAGRGGRGGRGGGQRGGRGGRGGRNGSGFRGRAGARSGRSFLGGRGGR